MAEGHHPGRAAGLAAGQDQGGQPQLGAGFFGQTGYLAAEAHRGYGRRRRLHPRVGDPVAEGNPRRPISRCGGVASAAA